MAFFQLCQADNFAKTLLYHEVPKYYTWNTTSKMFYRRKRGAVVLDYAGVRASDALGQVYTVHPNNAECYFLRMLLHTVKGPTSFQALKTVNEEICGTYREACYRLGLLENDQHWDTTLAEAALTCLPPQIRTLFAIILTTCAPSDPKNLWEKNKESMSGDILRQARRTNPNVEIQFSDDIFNQALILLEDRCISINNKIFCQLGLPAPTRDRNNVHDRDLVRERQYNSDELRHFVDAQKQLLTADQKIVLEKVMQHVANESSGIIFLDAPGGTGKTFLLNLILAEIRSKNDIALAEHRLESHQRYSMVGVQRIQLLSFH